MTTKRTTVKPKKKAVKVRVPVKALFVDRAGTPVVEVPLPKSEWRRIWDVLVAQMKGVLP